MAKPQHRTPEHRAARKAIDQAQARGEVLWCVEPVCLHPARWIQPWEMAHVSHNTAGTVILGPSHWLCNLSEAGKRGHAKQMGRVTAVTRRVL